MPHHAKPFFRTGRGWHVQLGKQPIKLCDGPKNSDTEAAAWERCHSVMAEHAQPAPRKSPQAGGPLVAEVLDRYLDWRRKHNAPRTYEWYLNRVRSFPNSLPEAAAMAVADLKPFHVVEWADSHPDWSPAYRRGAVGGVRGPHGGPAGRLPPAVRPQAAADGGRDVGSS